MSDRVPWPGNVTLELTNVCDLHCTHCHFHGAGVEKERRLQFMAESVWRAAVDEIAGWDTALTIQPWGMGESLLHPDFWQVVAAIKRHDKLQIGLYSNGMQWEQADIEAAIDLEMDWLCISVDGLRRDVFERYRAGADFDRVVGTVHALADARRRRGAAKPELRVNMVVYPELEDHVDEFVAAWRGVVDYVTASHFRAIGERRFSRHELPRLPCYQLRSIMPIGVDGRVAQCCEDPQGRQVVGWFPRQSLAEIWHGRALAARRRAHDEGRFIDASPLCEQCDGWSAVHELEHPAKGVRKTERTTGFIYRYETA